MVDDKALGKMARDISGRIYDVVVDTSLTPGQTLTVLRMIEKTLSQEIAACEDSVRRITKMRRPAKGDE